MAGIEMGDQNESHAAIGRGMAEELLEGLQTTGRSAQTDYREAVILSMLIFRARRRDRLGFFLGHCKMLCLRGIAAAGLGLSVLSR
ncbi:MAG: hypothetical protein Q7T40_09625 [Methylobacter sp.]|nr:hypothetical protein [Methylobacter sp.]